MARPRADANRIPTRDRILSAAQSAFGAHGFEATRLADVAAAAGIRRPSLLYHFERKEELYAAVVRGAFTELSERLTRALGSGGDFRARVEAVVSGYVSFLDQRPEFAALLLREILDGRGPGRALLLEQVVPLLDLLETFLAGEGAGLLRSGLPVRAAVLQVATAALVRASSGPLRRPLWGDGDRARELALSLLLDE